jgi:hypothetical protein
MNKNIPVRLDYYQYCIETWEKLLNSIDLRDKSKIIDLCSGWSPKLELALIKTNFKGDVFIIDESKENLQCLLALISPFNKNYKIKPVLADLLKESCSIHADVVLANHIMDDLLISLYLKKRNLKINPFESMILMKKIWKEMLIDKESFNKIFYRLRNFLYSVTNKSGYILIAQYCGYQENLYGLCLASQACKKLAKRITDSLVDSGDFVEEKELIKNAFKYLKNPYFAEKDIICLRRAD